MRNCQSDASSSSSSRAACASNRSRSGSPGRPTASRTSRSNRRSRLGIGGPIRLLVREIGLGVGDAPVAVAAGKALLVEVEIDPVSGIAVLPAPHLERGDGIAPEAAHARLGPDPIGKVGAILGRGLGALRAPRQMAKRFEAIGVDAEWLAAADQMRVDEGVLEAVARAQRLETRALARRAGQAAGAVHRGRGPGAGGSIRALRQPDAARRASEVSAMGGDQASPSLL